MADTGMSETKGNQQSKEVILMERGKCTHLDCRRRTGVVAGLERWAYRRGLRSKRCHSSRRGAAELRRGQFDVLVSDLLMPKMDGIQLLHQAFAIDRNLVGIIMTGLATIETASQAVKQGAFDYVVKPFKLSTILETLHRGMAQQSPPIAKTFNIAAAGN